MASFRCCGPRHEEHSPVVGFSNRSTAQARREPRWRLRRETFWTVVAAKLEAAEDDLLAFTAFPPAHWSKIWSNSLIERELKRPTNVVHIFPNAESAIRLVGATLVKVNGEISPRQAPHRRRVRLSSHASSDQFRCTVIRNDPSRTQTWVVATRDWSGWEGGLVRRDSDPGREFSAMYREHLGAVAAYASRRTTAADAIDAVAETFTIAWRRFDEIPPDHRLPWLYGVARRVIANQARGIARRNALHERLREDWVGSRADDLPDLSPLAAALRSLNQSDQELLLLAGAEELTPMEIATVLSVSPEVARNRLSRARERLRAVMNVRPAESEAENRHAREVQR